MEILLKGILTGLLLSVLVGATFFMLIETSMTRGFKAALWFDLGVVASDATIIAVVYFFTSWINQTVIQNEYFNTAGGLIFMGFGVNYILSRQRYNASPGLKIPNLRLFLNGFAVNLMNPSVVLFWLGTMALTLSKFKLNGRETLVYYTTTLGVMASIDVLKAYFAYKISKFISVRILRMIYIISGILMIGIGIYFVMK